MSLHLTPEMLEAAYELLRNTPPFKGWGLPDSDEVEFHVAPMKGRDQADYVFNGKHHQIRVNPKKHKTLRALLETMAHEMVHLHLATECPQDMAHHGQRFQRKADQVCRHHVFDRGQF